MILQPPLAAFPATIEEFLQWEPCDGFKYEWNNGEVIRFEKMKKRQLVMIRTLNRLFILTDAYKMAEHSS